MLWNNRPRVTALLSEWALVLIYDHVYKFPRTTFPLPSHFSSKEFLICFWRFGWNFSGIHVFIYICIYTKLNLSFLAFCTLKYLFSPNYSVVLYYWAQLDVKPKNRMFLQIQTACMPPIAASCPIIVPVSLVERKLVCPRLSSRLVE